jgi:hypothetical protein
VTPTTFDRIDESDWQRFDCFRVFVFLVVIDDQIGIKLVNLFPKRSSFLTGPDDTVSASVQPSSTELFIFIDGPLWSLLLRSFIGVFDYFS